jgi:long-subunit acyl-CoA synthetase (AMP-forming)
MTSHQNLVRPIIEPDFSPETGELTPTLKLKRRVIEVKHQRLLDEMYEPEVAAHTERR